MTGPRNTGTAKLKVATHRTQFPTSSRPCYRVRGAHLDVACNSGPAACCLGSSGWKRVAAPHGHLDVARCAELLSFSDADGNTAWPMLP